MRLITCPADVVVKLDDGEKEFPFKKTLVAHLDNYGELKTVSQIREAQKVIDAIEAGNGTIALEDTQYDLLAAACKRVIYIPRVTRQLIAYYDAIDKAEEVKK